MNGVRSTNQPKKMQGKVPKDWPWLGETWWHLYVMKHAGKFGCRGFANGLSWPEEGRMLQCLRLNYTKEGNAQQWWWWFGGGIVSWKVEMNPLKPDISQNSHEFDIFGECTSMLPSFPESRQISPYVQQREVLDRDIRVWPSVPQQSLMGWWPGWWLTYWCLAGNEGMIPEMIHNHI